MAQINIPESEKRSPYEHLKKLCLEKKINRKNKLKIEFVLDFCLSLPRFCDFSSEKIFLTCITMVLKLKPNIE